MKKMMKTLLCVLLILSCVPFALAEDDFTLRSGIVFGDTLEQIVSKEQCSCRTRTIQTRSGKNCWL